jgi:hypothetical protein
MNFLKALGIVVVNSVKNSAKMNSLSKADIIDILELNIESHTIMKTAIKDLTPTQWRNILIKYNKNIEAYQKFPSKKVISELPKGLRDEARKANDEKPFSAYYKTTDMFIKIQKDILKHIDTIMEQKEANIFNVRISFVALLGILRQSELYGTYLSYLFDQLMTVAGNDQVINIPGYRPKYLIDHYKEFIEITNLICNKKGRYSFLTEMENMKRKNANLVLYSNGQPASVFAKASDYTKSTVSYIVHGLYVLNIFLWIGESIEDYKHSRYLRNQNLKQWMESHVANLRLELSDMDPDSKEAIRLQKIIQAYDVKISEYDRKINEYLESD